jgi:hypothetical protein
MLELFFLNQLNEGVIMLDIPWDYISKEFVCAAMDANGKVYMYYNEPSKGNKQWNGKYGREVSWLFDLDTSIHWADSKTMRPKL